jgi:hypothetical protein
MQKSRKKFECLSPIADRNQCEGAVIPPSVPMPKSSATGIGDFVIDTAVGSEKIRKYDQSLYRNPRMNCGTVSLKESKQ